MPGAGSEYEKVIKQVHLPDGWKVELWRDRQGPSVVVQVRVVDGEGFCHAMGLVPKVQHVPACDPRLVEIGVQQGRDMADAVRAAQSAAMASFSTH